MFFVSAAEHLKRTKSLIGESWLGNNSIKTKQWLNAQFFYLCGKPHIQGLNTFSLDPSLDCLKKIFVARAFDGNFLQLFFRNATFFWRFLCMYPWCFWYQTIKKIHSPLFFSRLTLIFYGEKEREEKREFLVVIYIITPFIWKVKQGLGLCTFHKIGARNIWQK